MVQLMLSVPPGHGTNITSIVPLHAFGLGQLLIQTLLGAMLLLLDIHGGPLMVLGLLGVPYGHGNGLAAEWLGGWGWTDGCLPCVP